MNSLKARTIALISSPRVYLTFTAGMFVLGLVLGGIMTWTQLVLFAIAWAIGMLANR